MVKKATAFFFPGSYFLFLSFFSHDFHRKNVGFPLGGSRRFLSIFSLLL